MDKSNINYLGIIGCAFLYAITSFACAFLGFLSPWCWIVVFPVLAAILGAPSYLWAASRWQQFGVGTLFSLILAVILLVMGEIDFTQTLLMVAVGIVSDVVRQMIPNGLSYSASGHHRVAHETVDQLRVVLSGRCGRDWHRLCRRTQDTFIQLGAHVGHHPHPRRRLYCHQSCCCKDEVK